MNRADPVRQEVRVRCRPAHAFTVFTTRIDAWWPESHRRFPESTLALGEGLGGALVETSVSGEVHQLGEVVRWEPPDLLCFSWRLGAPPSAPTLAFVRFEADHDHTVVKVEHVEGPHALPDWARTASIFHRSWRHVLDAFAACLHILES
jgi:uncharacterized protein YndB with AHSA1/START domain